MECIQQDGSADPNSPAPPRRVWRGRRRDERGRGGTPESLVDAGPLAAKATSSRRVALDRLIRGDNFADKRRRTVPLREGYTTRDGRRLA